MVVSPPLLSARFVARPDRYLIVAERNGRELEAAGRDPGRLGWLLRPGLPLRPITGGLPVVLPRDAAP